ncbi:hypothetical protein A3844_28935 [Paenibacillus helianthi]|uniref:DUF4231 domain-containing protein n=2 Tax=Paenibacillus helianthi TaxID=1349432 RepID=A0ABX3EFQ0_9BACL|nr:hypothetical protein A3844_28935 [Paenibacillus helianthi]
MKLLQEIVGISMDANNKKMKRYMQNGVIVRVAVVSLSFLVTLLSGWDVKFGEFNAALLFSALLTGVTSLESFFLFNRKFRIYYDNITRLSVIDTKIGMAIATESYTEPLYEEWLGEYIDIQKIFHENRIDVMKAAESIGM